MGNAYLEVGRELSWKAENVGPGECHGAGWLGSFFVFGLREAQTGMAGQVSRTDAGMGAGVKCPPARPAASTNGRIAVASFGTPPKGSRVSGECFLVDAHPSLPFPNDLSLLCFAIGPLLRVISFHLSCRCSVSAALIDSVQPCGGPQPTLSLPGERLSLHF